MNCSSSAKKHGSFPEIEKTRRLHLTFDFVPQTIVHKTSRGLLIQIFQCIRHELLWLCTKSPLMLSHNMSFKKSVIASYRLAITWCASETFQANFCRAAEKRSIRLWFAKTLEKKCQIQACRSEVINYESSYMINFSIVDCMFQCMIHSQPNLWGKVEVHTHAARQNNVIAPRISFWFVSFVSAH